MEWLPAAERDPHPEINNLTFVDEGHPKGVLHTTETKTWPSYGGWKVPPHGTVLPVPGKGVVVRQHIPLSRAAFALKNLPGGVQTNRARVWQWELIGTSEKGGPGLWWPAADDVVLLDLWDKVIEPLHGACGIPLRALPFQGYPESYGPLSGTNDVRLTGVGWASYSGWLGHQHVPENVHGDPGDFPWPRMAAAVERRRIEREEPLMALSDADAAKIGKQVAREVVRELLGQDTIPDKVAVAAGADPATPQGTVSLRTVFAEAYAALRRLAPPAQ